MQKKRLPKSISRPRNDDEFKLLKKIGDRIHRDLAKKGRPVEWLAFEAETARSTIRRIFDGDANIGVVTLNRVAQALGYKDVVEFFQDL
jgi:ribosome-binding protein aMBF1 (putative translation factor)